MRPPTGLVPAVPKNDTFTLLVAILLLPFTPWLERYPYCGPGTAQEQAP